MVGITPLSETAPKTAKGGDGPLGAAPEAYMQNASRLRQVIFAADSAN